MRKQPFIITFLSLIIVLLLATQAFAQAEKSLYAKSYDVDITVLPNGDMRVIERQTIAFTQGSFHEGFAVIPTGRAEGIVDVQVSGDGQPYREGHGKAGTFHVERESNQISIVWNFEYTHNSTHVYELHYTVKGGLRYYPEYGEVWWKAIPPEHAYYIQKALIQVHLPPGATILTDPQSGQDYAGLAPDLGAAAVKPDRLGATFAINQTIGENQEVEVRVRYKPGVVAGQAPAWQAAFDQQQEWNEKYRPTANLLLGLLGAVVMLGGPLLVLGWWYTFGRDPAVGLVADQVSELPADTPPGLVGTLVDETADLQDILATLIDLARRGYLTITETSSSKRMAARDFTYRRTGRPDSGLSQYERLLLSAVFRGQAEQRLSLLKNTFYTAIPGIQTALYNDLVKEGFFTKSPDAVRSQYGCAGFLVLGLAALVGFGLLVAASDYADAVICPAIGLGVTGVVLLIAGQYMPHKTRKGAEAAAVWRAFKNHLTQLEKYNLAEARDRFEDYLPYAVAFGLERSVIRKFAAVQAPVPTWYMPHRPIYTHHDHGHPAGQAMPAPAGSLGKEGMPSVQQMSDGMASSLQGMSDGLISMFNSASKIFTSQPSSSGSGKGGWSSGGGFHGGGGGGGGSRGFR